MSSANDSSAIAEFREGWGPLLAATVGTMCGLLTVTNYSQGFFVGPVTADLGWSAPQFFLGFTVMMCVGMFSGPFVGSLASRVGIRTLGIVGLIGHALAYWVISLNDGSLLLWYLSFSLLAILGAGSLPIIWTSVLNGYFVKHRGKAIGITMAGTGLGAFILPPVVEFCIDNYGWRIAYRAIGTGALLCRCLSCWHFFERRSQSLRLQHVTEDIHHRGCHERKLCARTASGCWVLFFL